MVGCILAFLDSGYKFKKEKKNYILAHNTLNTVLQQLVPICAHEPRTFKDFLVVCLREHLKFVCRLFPY